MDTPENLLFYFKRCTTMHLSTPQGKKDGKSIYKSDFFVVISCKDEKANVFIC